MTRAHRIKLIFLVLALVGVSCLHYFTTTGHEYHRFHDIYRRLYYIPIILASFWFGLRGGVFACCAVSLAYLPHVVYQWQDRVFIVTQILEIVLYNVVGLVTGYLSQRQMDERARYKTVAQELDESYRKLKEQTNVLVQIEEQLRRAERLSALGELSAGIAHEIRNPLASVKGTAEIIADKFNPDDKEYEFAQILIKEVTRLDKVVSEFLEFARPKLPELTRCDINEAVRAVALLTEREMAHSKIELETELEEGLPSISADTEQIRQVFLNLVLNAIQAMPNGGALKIKTLKKDGQIVCSFSDTGSGIRRADQKKVFNPFFTTKPKGTGLGLAIVHRVVENLGGDITFTSEEGNGTTFTITFPIAQGARRVERSRRS